MSGQPQRVGIRRNGSPSTKQGPMKATVPYPLVMPVMTLTSSPTRGTSSSKKCSPSSSPTGEHRAKQRRRSPDSRASPERISPISPCFNKVDKPVKLNAATNAIHRTKSLENFAAPTYAYLTGQWPRDLAVSLPTVQTYTSDKFTQTPPDWELDNTEKKKKNSSNHKHCTSPGAISNEALIDVKYKRIKQRLQKTKEGSKQNAGSSRERNSPIPGDHNAIGSQQTNLKGKSGPIPISNIPKTFGPRFRGSVEGFNPEIERLFPVQKVIILGNEDDEKHPELIPDGHRAPVAELLQVSNTRSIDTQTPSSSLAVDECCNTFQQDEIQGSSTCSSSVGSISSSRAASESPNCIPGHMETDSPQYEHKEEKMELDSQCKYSTSPLNQSFRREPPDGCEKVKTVDEARNYPMMREAAPLYSPVKPEAFCIPSAGSAFCPLYKSYVSQATGTSNPVMRSSPVETQ